MNTLSPPCMRGRFFKIHFMRLTLLVAMVLLSAVAVAQPAVGTTVPEIALKDVNGNTVTLSSLRGKVVLIDFWASWCGPCRKTNRLMVRLYPKLKAKGFEIYSISIDDDVADWKKAIAADKITWLQVNEKNGWNGPVANAWKIEQIPATFLIDKEGVLVAVDPDERLLEKKVSTLLKK